MMHSNMGMMADITSKIYQLMSNGQMNPAQEKQVLEIMNQMSQMMQEMSVPHGEKVKKQHKQDLQEMGKKVDSLYDSLNR